MKAVVVLLIAFFGLSLAYTEKEYQTAFTQWMQQNQKSYSSSEFSKRYGIFKTNMDFVQQWNSDPNNHRVGMTSMADLSNEEYRSIYLGTRIDGTARLAAAQDNLSAPNAANPASVDWVKAGAVTAIKNQGQCGSCWSFSTTGSTEGAHYLKTKNLVSLSEQNLMDCSTSYGNNGCDGGLMDNAFKYIIANKGIDTEASYPYTAEDGTCHYKAANSGATLSKYTDVSSGDESALETAAVGAPVSVAIDASHNSFQLYSSGVYYEKACSATQLDHGVLVAGYGTSGSDKYWLVKNSWGTSWGQNGYIWMSKDRSNNCGIATSASWPTA